MPQRKESVRPPVTRHKTSRTRKPAVPDVDGPKETSRLKSELNKAVERQEAVAIDNTRLLEELRQRTGELSEATQQQTAISLRVISNSQRNLGPVLESVAMHAARICEALYVDILIVEDGILRNRAAFGTLF